MCGLYTSSLKWVTVATAAPLLYGCGGCWSARFRSGCCSSTPGEDLPLWATGQPPEEVEGSGAGGADEAPWPRS